MPLLAALARWLGNLSWIKLAVTAAVSVVLLSMCLDYRQAMDNIEVFGPSFGPMPVGSNAMVRSHGMEYSAYACLSRTVALSLSCLITVLLVYLCVINEKLKRPSIIIGSALVAILGITLVALYCGTGLNAVWFGQEKLTRLLGYLMLAAASTSLAWILQLRFRQLNLLFVALLLTLLCLSTLSAWSSYDDGNGAVVDVIK